ncbi:MAG: LuxR C-terminal-related transcriptional regulator [Acidimicrobiales bacterium]
MASEERLADAYAALAQGRWGDARGAFEQALANGETAEGHFGLAAALWWLGENQACVDRCSHAYSLFCRSGDVESAAQCAVWLAITYKANFANFAAANGWIGRAERLLQAVEPGPLHGWVWVARAYRMADLDGAEDLAARAVEVARSAGDVDLELVALAQLGLVRVGKGETDAGFALIDEAMAAALAGERSSLDTVVYACCDMLNACELASDIERAAQWCAVADDFVATYGCPFLYAECRIFYGSVLTAKGRWDDAARELGAGLRITDGACPGLHAKALTRLAGLRIRQGRLEEAEQLLAHLGEGVEAQAEEALSLGALLLARGDAPAASRNLEQRLHHLEEHRSHLAAALDLLVDAHLATGDLEGAGVAARRLADIASSVRADRVAAMAAGAEGRLSLARGDPEAAVGHLEAALGMWSRLELPFELARTRFELGRVLALSQPDVAIDHARRALAAFETLGAALDADRVGAFLRSHGVAAGAGPRGIGLLTAREQEVLRLLGGGLSNPEIAARLYVSRKTASHHVSSILTKLNLRNRAEAAAYAVGALGPPHGRSGPR